MLKTFYPLLLTSLLLLPACVTGHRATDTMNVAALSAGGRNAGANDTYIRRAADDTSDTGDATAGGDSLDTAADTLGTASLPLRLSRLLDNPIFDRTQVGLYVWDLTADTLVYAYHERQCLRPASNQKLVTAITALEVLGTDYRYHTRFYADTVRRDTTLCARLCVRGGYDALLSREDLRAVADSLKELGVRRIVGAVGTDLSYKDDKRLGWGWCWDDEEERLTPLLYRGRDRFAAGLSEALHEAGIVWDGTTAETSIPDSLTLLCDRTHTIDEALLPMMKQSDNTVAESLFYQIAHHRHGRGAGRKHAVRCINDLVREVGLDPAHYQFADGSGLSLYNYATPELLGRLLRHAYRDSTVYRHLAPSLPIAGEDGSLRRRMRGTPAAGNVRAKTGTVEGVSTLSGYLHTAGGNLLCFSIMNQGVRHTSTGRNFQDRVCRALCR